jgi:hypothetical protein
MIMKLFYSFSFLLSCLQHGLIVPNDLEDGIFAFQTNRTLVLSDDSSHISVQHFLEQG